MKFLQFNSWQDVKVHIESDNEIYYQGAMDYAPVPVSAKVIREPQEAGGNNYVRVKPNVFDDFDSFIADETYLQFFWYKEKKEASQMTWEQTRALEALMEIADNALQTSIAICPEDGDRELIATFQDNIHTARAALVPAKDLLLKLAKR